MKSRKRGKKKKKPAIRLEKIIGSTCDTQYGMSVDNSTGTVAYIAGCVVIIYDFRKNTQEQFITHNNPLTCVSFSPNGSYLAVGTRGRFPEIVIYDRNFKKVQTISKKQRPHYHGVYGFSWSPDEKYLLSFGNEHDRWVKLWNVQSGEKEAGIKHVKTVYTATFSKDGKSFSVLGEKFAKCFYIKMKQGKMYLDGVLLDLSSLSDATFTCSSSPSNNELYCVTKKGILALFSTKKSLARLLKWVNLKSSSGHSIFTTEDDVFCGCAKGVLRVFTTKNLKYKATLPTPPPVHSHITSASQTNLYSPSEKNTQECGNVISVQYFGPGKKVNVMYSDRSFIVWDITDLKKIAKLSSFLAHNDSIWSVDLITTDDGPLRENSFCTASDDGTIRFWKLRHSDTEEYKSKKKRKKRTQRDSIASENLFCRNLLHIIKLNKDQTQQEGNGIRVIKVTPNGKHLASGDRQGNLRFHDLYQFRPLTSEAAHDSEILSLDFVPLPNDEEEEEEGEDDGYDSEDSTAEKISGNCLLATGSRDRHIHLFKFGERTGCRHIKTLANDHNSSVTSVKFASTGTHLFSCGADRKIVFRKVVLHDGPESVQAKSRAVDGEDKSVEIVKYADKYVRSGKIYDMDMDQTQKYIMTCEQDKNLKIWDVEKAKIQRTYKIDKKAGEPIRIKTCPSGIHSVTSSSDKVLRLYDFYSGKCYAICRGHSEVVTGLRFTTDCKRLVTVGCDGLICIWRFSSKLEKNMLERIAEIKAKEREIRRKKKKKMMKKKIKKGVTKPRNEASPPKKLTSSLELLLSSKQSERGKSPIDQIQVDEVEPLRESQLSASLKEGMEKGAEALEGIIQTSVQFRETNLPDWLKNDNTQTTEENKPEHTESPTKAVPAKKNKWGKDVAMNLMSLAQSVRDRDPSVVFSEDMVVDEVEFEEDYEDNVTKNSPRQDSEEVDDKVLYYQNKDEDGVKSMNQSFHTQEDVNDKPKKEEGEDQLEEEVKSSKESEDVESESSKGKTETTSSSVTSSASSGSNLSPPTTSKYANVFENIDEPYYQMKRNPLRQSITSHWMSKFSNARSTPYDQPQVEVTVIPPPEKKKSDDEVFRRSNVKVVEVTTPKQDEVMVEEETVVLVRSSELQQEGEVTTTTTTEPTKKEKLSPVKIENNKKPEAEGGSISYSERETLEEMRKRVNVPKTKTEDLLPPKIMNRQKVLDDQLEKWKRLIEDKEKSVLLNKSSLSENSKEEEVQEVGSSKPQEEEEVQQETVTEESENKKTVVQYEEEGEVSQDEEDFNGSGTLLADDGITIIRRSIRKKKKEEEELNETIEEEKLVTTSENPKTPEKVVEVVEETSKPTTNITTSKEEEEKVEDEKTMTPAQQPKESPKSVTKNLIEQQQQQQQPGEVRTPVTPTRTEFSPHKGKKMLEAEKALKEVDEETKRRKAAEAALINRFRLSNPVSEHKRVIESLRNSIFDAVKMYQEFSEDLHRSRIFPQHKMINNNNNLKDETLALPSDDEEEEEDVDDEQEEEEQEEVEEEVEPGNNMMKGILSDYESLFSVIEEKLISKHRTLRTKTKKKRKRKKKKKKNHKKKVEEEEEVVVVSPMSNENDEYINNNPMNPTPMVTPRDYGEGSRSVQQSQQSMVMGNQSNMMYMSMSDVQMQMEKFSNQLMQNSLKIFEKKIQSAIEEKLKEK